MNNAEIRLKLQKLMYQTVYDQAHHGNWDYREIRPLPIVSVTYHPGQRIESDCSYGTKLLCHAADAPDPTGFNYQGYGNTVSMWEHLPHIPQEQTLPGDVIIFGQNGADHVAMLYQWSAGHCWLWNMGSQGDPRFSKLGDQLAYFGSRPHQWCQILKPAPTKHLKGNPPQKGPK